MPKREYQFWIYILSNRSHILYIGVTNNLTNRVADHRKYFRTLASEVSLRISMGRAKTYRYVAWAILLLFGGLVLHANAPKSPATATVVFYRYKQFEGSAANATIYCDGTKLVHLRNGRFYEALLPLGRHVCYANEKKYGTVLEIEPSNKYYFRLAIEGGVMGHFQLYKTTPEQWEYDVSNIKPSERSDIEH